MAMPKRTMGCILDSRVGGSGLRYEHRDSMSECCITSTSRSTYQNVTATYKQLYVQYFRPCSYSLYVIGERLYRCSYMEDTGNGREPINNRNGSPIIVLRSETSSTKTILFHHGGEHSSSPGRFYFSLFHICCHTKKIIL